MLAAVVGTLTGLVDAVDDRLPWWAEFRPLELRLRSRRGLDGPLDRISAPRLWDPWHDAAVLSVLILQVGLVPVFGYTALQALSQPEPTAVNDPANAVAIPGINEFMPLSVAAYVVGALVLATAVHEGAHAVACRREGIPVTEWGVVLLCWVLPIAAYVMPGDELDRAPPRSRVRVFAAGILANVVLAGVALGGLYLPWTGGAGEAYVTYFGWALVGGSPPTAAAVWSLGPVTNLLFWTALLSGNLAAMNALPVGILDGGRVLGTVLRELADRVDVPASAAVNAVRVVGLITVVLVVVTLVAPHFAT